ncbi:hypothetical protein OXU95_18000, partial [Escherichia coli]
MFFSPGDSEECKKTATTPSKILDLTAAAFLLVA